MKARKGGRRNRRQREPLRRRAARVLRKAVKVLLVAVALPALAYGGFQGYRYVTTTERFALREMNITGTERLSPQEVELLSGVLVATISMRLLPRKEKGRVPAVELMVNTALIADIIKEEGRLALGREKKARRERSGEEACG